MNAETKTRCAKRVVYGQPSWRVASSEVEAFVTETGGHVGPVTFDRHGQRLQPYSVAPWVEEENDPPRRPVIRILRGDFFCMPFGGNATVFRGEGHPVHGETANARWRFESLETSEGQTSLRLSLKTKVRPGRVDKEISLRNGENMLYSHHIISGMSGPMSFGHHAMLKFPDPPGSGLVSTSRFVYAQVLPGPFELPEKRGYSCLKPGARFESLEAVPTMTGETADLTRYPARRGFEDLVTGERCRRVFCLDSGGVPEPEVCLVCSERPSYLAGDRSVDLQWRTALSTLEQPAHQCDGAGGGHFLFSPWFGGISPQESSLRQRISDLSASEPEKAPGDSLHHGHRQNTGGI
jgi:hypothetical protein